MQTLPPHEGSIISRTKGAFGLSCTCSDCPGMGVRVYGNMGDLGVWCMWFLGFSRCSVSTESEGGLLLSEKAACYKYLIPLRPKLGGCESA